MGWKRVAAGMAVVASVALGSTVAGGSDGGRRPTVEVDEVTWTISWENCSELGRGAVIEGAGTRTSVTTEQATGGGATAVNNVSIAVGTATDQAGNTYSWIYDNRSWVTNTIDAPAEFSGVMVDDFMLSGDGPEHLKNGFAANYSYSTTDETAISIVPWNVFGDPIDFETVQARCDPL